MMEPPQEPHESDCCNSGCNPCILDVYESQLEKYRQWLKTSHSGGKPQFEINAITPTVYTIFELIDRRQVAPTVFWLKFKYADARDEPPNCLLYKPGQYFLLKGKDHEGEFTRAYTPIPGPHDEGFTFTVLVRLYEVGRMSKLLKRFRLGDRTSWRGPYGEFVVDYSYKYLFFVAQGTGIAPIFAVIREIVNNEEAECFIKLFFCCRNSDDILLRDKLYEMGAYWNFSCEIFLSDKSNLTRKYNETVHESKLGSHEIDNYLSNKCDKSQTIICGSDSFSEYIRTCVINAGICSKHIYVF